jgi:hypothetical protein
VINKERKKVMNADRINIQAGSAKLNLAIIKRSRKIGGNVWGHIWEEGGRVCACSELTDKFILNGISFLDGKYIKKIKYEFSRSPKNSPTPPVFHRSR